jgi:hypothetical protein
MGERDRLEAVRVTALAQIRRFPRLGADDRVYPFVTGTEDRLVLRKPG